MKVENFEEAEIKDNKLKKTLHPENDTILCLVFVYLSFVLVFQNKKKHKTPREGFK